MTYLGANIDLTAVGPFRPRRGCRRFGEVCPSNARVRLVLLGYLVSLMDLVPFVDYTCGLSIPTSPFFRPTSQELWVIVHPALHLDQIFQWWCAEANLYKGVTFRTGSPFFTLTTEQAYRMGSAYTRHMSLAYVWEEKLMGTHINVMELLAVFCPLKLLQHRMCGRLVLFWCDNTSAVSYINRQGGTIAVTGSTITWNLFTWLRWKYQAYNTNQNGNLNEIVFLTGKAWHWHIWAFRGVYYKQNSHSSPNMWWIWTLLWGYLHHSLLHNFN